MVLQNLLYLFWHFYADFLCLYFYDPASASAFVTDIETGRGRVRGESDCRHFKTALATALASEPLSETGFNYFCRELNLPLLLLLRRLLLLVLLLLRR